MTTASYPRQGSSTDALVIGAYRRCEWHELALMRHGFTPERLQLLARRVAADQCRLRGASLGDRMDDLVSRLVIAGLQAVLRYDPTRFHASYGSNGGDPFESYLADIFERRAVDYWRSKGEGFGDRRYGNDNRYDLHADVDEATSAEPTDFDSLLKDVERIVWQVAAQVLGQDLDQWMTNALNAAAKTVKDATDKKTWQAERLSTRRALDEEATITRAERSAARMDAA